MLEVASFVEKGGAVLGICNGFQILTESHLLPGMLLRNRDQKFICRFVNLAVMPGNSAYQSDPLSNKVLKVPIAHGEGRYYCSAEDLAQLQGEGQVVFRYVDDDCVASDGANPNGSIANIAGIRSKNGRVLGMMPHPERAVHQLLGGSEDGRSILESFLASFL
jgi:phosphoribosylformylglycinamidine synthase